ncbi:MAG: flavodoxin family protein [Desulfobulbaceae bacterium]|nr:MAG: flavodoxin family protein [Desulfobulbaceae bacterium]
MRILGVSGSPRPGRTTDRVVQEVLAGAGGRTEFVSLAGKKIAPCRACLACVKDNRCRIKDDMVPLRRQLLAADALVIGAPNYFSNINALTHSFLERLCQFRHRDCRELANKYVVVVGVGGLEPHVPVAVISKMLPYFQMQQVGSITAQGAASCFSCGFGESCRAGAVQALYGPDVKITDKLIPDPTKQPEMLFSAHALGRKLAGLVQDKESLLRQAVEMKIQNRQKEVS